MSGKHGSLKRDFKHLPIELVLADGGKKAHRALKLAVEELFGWPCKRVSGLMQVVARMYFAKSKQCSMLNTATCPNESSRKLYA